MKPIFYLIKKLGRSLSLILNTSYFISLDLLRAAWTHAVICARAKKVMLKSKLGSRALAATKPQIKTHLDAIKNCWKREIAIIGSGLDFQLIVKGWFHWGLQTVDEDLYTKKVVSYFILFHISKQQHACLSVCLLISCKQQGRSF